MKEHLAILLVEDSEDDALLLLRELEHAGFRTIDSRRVDTKAALEAALGSQRWDVIISDYVMPRFSGLDALAMCRAGERDTPFIIVSGKIGEDVAVDAMRAGANDYVLKNSLARLAPAIEREIDEAHERQSRRDAEAELGVYREHLDELVMLKTGELRAANLAIQRASTAKSDFLSSMSHEFRTPLNSILGFTDMIERGMAGPVTDEQSKQLGMIHESARQLLSLVNDLLDLASIEAGKTKVELEPIDLKAYILLIEQLTTPIFAERGLKFVVDTHPTPEAIVSDPRKLQQVLVNLLGNAAKFTEAGEVRLLVRPQENEVCFDVIDTGVGIDPDELEHVFEQFRRAKPVRADAPRGTGLGLSISRELVGLLGGRISATSALGVGSTFTVCIPTEPESSSRMHMDE